MSFSTKRENLFNFSLSLENVFDRLEMADLYQIKSLHSACGKLIRCNLEMVKKNAKWQALKKNSPELAFSILEEFADESWDTHTARARHTRTWYSSGESIHVRDSPY
jgi:hypothetical protein